MDQTKQIIDKTMAALIDGKVAEYAYIPENDGANLPDIPNVKNILWHVKDLTFPGFFSVVEKDEKRKLLSLRDQFDELQSALREQIYDNLFFMPPKAENAEVRQQNREAAEKITQAFVEKLPEIKRLLCTDVQAMYANDPAATCREEIILCYPSILAMIHYRVAHELVRLGVPVLPRIITELAHSQTGIDIHPGAQIGEYFSIDHGTGVVIGETCIIGNHVHLYKGVTLGARNITLDENGNPVNTPRHPIIEDNVIIYSNATILGRITIGRDSVIGGNVWLTNSVPPNSRIIQHKASTADFA